MLTSTYAVPDTLELLHRQPVQLDTHKAGRKSQIARVLATVALAGERGLTRAEIAQALEMPIQSVCWTVAALRKAGLLSTSVLCRAGSSVLVATED